MLQSLPEHRPHPPLEQVSIATEPVLPAHCHAQPGHITSGYHGPQLPANGFLPPGIYTFKLNFLGQSVLAGQVLFQRESGGKDFPSLGAAPSEDSPSGFCAHAGKKAVLILAFPVTETNRNFHNTFLNRPAIYPSRFALRKLYFVLAVVLRPNTILVAVGPANGDLCFYTTPGIEIGHDFNHPGSQKFL